MAKKDKKNQAVKKEEGGSEIAKKFKQSPLLYIGSVFILVLVVVTFIGGDFFSGGGGMGGGDLTFGYYDKVPVSYVPGNKFSQYYEQLGMNYRDQVDLSNPQVAMSLWSQAFEAAAVHTAVLQELKKSNFEVPEKAVDREVARLPQFQENGRFSPALYRQMPDTSRLSLWRQVREELSVIMYYNDLFGLAVPQGEIDFIANMASDMRTFELVSFPIDDFPQSEYLAFAEENTELFDSIHLSRIIVNSGEKEAAKILESVKNGTTTFEDAAKAQSQDGFADRGGDMGVRYVFELEREITNPDDLQKILSLGGGELSGVVQVDTRWAFFRVENEMKPADFNDSAVMDKVRSYMRGFQSGRMEDWAIAQANDFISAVESAGFSGAARAIGKEVRNIGPLPINYGSVDLFPSIDTPELSDLARNTNFWKIAFSTPLNTSSQPIVNGRNVFVFFQTEQSESQESRAEEIASMYSSYWLNYITEMSLQPYFMNSPKMDNRFFETYYRLFMGETF